MTLLVVENPWLVHLLAGYVDLLLFSPFLFLEEDLLPSFDLHFFGKFLYREYETSYEALSWKNCTHCQNREINSEFCIETSGVFFFSSIAHHVSDLF